MMKYVTSLNDQHDETHFVAGDARRRRKQVALCGRVLDTLDERVNYYGGESTLVKFERARHNADGDSGDVCVECLAEVEKTIDGDAAAKPRG